MEEGKLIKALVVDDAAFMRKQLVDVLSRSGDIEVVAVARHGLEALEAIKTVNPDVVTLDVDMPVMDGLTTIKHIMVKNPVPVVMVSGLADQGRITFEALRLGAIDFFPKPSGTISRDIKDKSEELIRTLKLAAGANPKAIKRATSRVDKKDLEQSHKSKGVYGAVLVLARQGSVSSFIRLMTALKGMDNVGLVCIQDISETVLKAYGKELDNVFNCIPFTGKPTSMLAGRWVLISEANLPDMRMSKDDFSMEFSGGLPSLTSFVGRFADQYGKRLCLVVLGGQLPVDISFLDRVLTTDGQVLCLDPEKCACSQFPQFIKEKGIGYIVASETELWERIRGFSRRFLFEDSKHNQTGDNP